MSWSYTKTGPAGVIAGQVLVEMTMIAVPDPSENAIKNSLATTLVSALQNTTPSQNMKVDASGSHSGGVHHLSANLAPV